MSPIVVALILAIPASSADGRINVRPAPHEAHLRLDGERVVIPRTAKPAIPVGGQIGNQPVTLPTSEPIIACRVDEELGIYGCRTTPDPEQEPEEERELTPGDVLRATREIGLPSLKVQIQPGEKTLVNVETIFYAQPQTFARSVSLLGFDVDVEAEPVSYEWIHGDGTTAVTDTPGKPYPAKDVTHRYRAPADDVQPRVDVTYRVKYRVDDGPWQTIGQTLLASGPAAELDVKEAAPVMTTPQVSQ